MANLFYTLVGRHGLYTGISLKHRFKKLRRSSILKIAQRDHHKKAEYNCFNNIETI